MRTPLPKGASQVTVEQEIVYYRASEGSNNNKILFLQRALSWGPLL